MINPNAPRAAVVTRGYPVAHWTSSVVRSDRPMIQIRIPVPSELELYVHRQVSDGAYASAGDFVCDLIREARLNTARRILDRVQQECGVRQRAVPGGPEP